MVEALDLVQRTEERFWEAELYRLKGQLLLQKVSQTSKARPELRPRSKRQRVKIPKTRAFTPSTQAEAEVEACFLQALRIARRQEAKSLELRAGMSLSRLWQYQGKEYEAHQLLAEIYSWFTEGLNTKDLQEAKVLLDDLKANFPTLPEGRLQ